jgi:hypothetical protein
MPCPATFVTYRCQGTTGHDGVHQYQRGCTNAEWGSAVGGDADWASLLDFVSLPEQHQY